MKQKKKIVFGNADFYRIDSCDCGRTSDAESCRICRELH